MHVTDFITSQFKKAGVELTAALTDVLNSPELTKIDLDDKLIRDVNERLLTFEVAKENPLLKQHFRKIILTHIDNEINDKYIPQYEIPDELSAPIKGEINTYEKINLMLDALKKLQEKKATATVGDKKALIEQIDKLNADILSEKVKAKTEIERLNTDNKNKELDWNIRGSFANYNYSDQYEKADAIELGIINLRKKLAQDGAKIILDTTGNLKLVNSADSSLDFTRENQKVSYQEYVDKLVAEKKLIKTSDSSSGAGAGNIQQQLPGNQNQNNSNNNSNDVVPNVAQADIMRDLKNALGNGQPVNN